MLDGLQEFLIENLGPRYVEPQSSDLAEMYNDSSPTTPLIFILSVGTDPAAELYKFAKNVIYAYPRIILLLSFEIITPNRI